ncbi:uncharacterized mitochondrial protein-like protein [Tanacetum coccineum]
MNRRKKHFAKLRAEEIRRNPPTKAQKKNQMSTYLKNMAGYKHSQLKSKSYDEIQKLFDKEMKRVNTFVDMNSEVVKGSETRTEESSKSAGDELESDKLKKQKIDKHVEAEKDDDPKEEEMKNHMEIVQDEEEIAIDAIPLATKPLMIVEYKIVKEGHKGFYHLIRADGSSKRYSSMIRMLQGIDREDLETLWKLVKEKHGINRPVDEYERVLWGDMKIMFEPDIKSEVWRSLQGYKDTLPIAKHTGNRPNWLFDIDALTISMNYKPVVAGNQTNGNAGTKENIDAGQARKKIVPDQEYILLPLLTSDPSLSKSSKDSPDAGFKPSGEEEKIDSEHPENKDSKVPNTEEPRVHQEQDANVNSTNNINTVCLTVNAADIENNVVDENIVYGCIDDLNMSNLEEIFLFQPTEIHRDHPLKQIIRDIHSAPQTRRMTKNVTKHAKIQMSSMGELTFFLGLQVKQKDDGIFISQHKYVADILKKFDFATVKTASTPMETNKALLKDEEAADVDVHLYRSMIGSLMYLTASRPDIMFVVCACARFQVTPKTSHLHVVKRIFRYLKGHPKLGLWYPRDSPFDLEAFSDSNYADASLDKKSTTGGCQFLRRRLISWQCKKQTIVANSITEAEYVTAANCCGQMKTKKATEISQSSGPIHLVLDETVIKEWKDRMERAATTASSIEAEQDSGNINRTQSMATLNESLPQGTGSSSGPMCQNTILRGAEAQIRFEAASKQSNDPPLLLNCFLSTDDVGQKINLM